MLLRPGELRIDIQRKVSFGIKGKVFLIETIVLEEERSLVKTVLTLWRGCRCILKRCIRNGTEARIVHTSETQMTVEVLAGRDELQVALAGAAYYKLGC